MSGRRKTTTRCTAGNSTTSSDSTGSFGAPRSNAGGLLFASQSASLPKPVQPRVFPSWASQSARFQSVQKDNSASPQLQRAAIAALQSSLSTGIFADSQFYLYSRYSRDGNVDTPLPVHASGAVLMQTTEYFQSLLTGGFSEDSVHAGLVLRSPDVRQQSRKLQRSIPACDYEYESDSDLDDEMDDSPSNDATEPETPTEAGSTHQDASVGTESPQTFESGGITATIDKTHEDAHSGRAASVSSDTTDGWKDDSEDRATGLKSSLAGRDDSDYELTSIPKYITHVVFIQDVAYRTAFVHYAYTGSIEFSALRSLWGSRPNTSVSESRTSELACSPKSMYRLADKYGLVGLKELAAQNIKSQLTPEVALPELLSRFTARYSQIRTLEIDFICTPGKPLSGSLTNLEEWMDRVVTGELPHAAPALVALIRKLGLRS
ncbi:hypothetical protein C8Q73DRAFT_485970 [Cubamyces lactineus]|nr:hypothetical protein C8Q73DRAFT_485970 [Cubamyces lactineus]